MKEKNARNETPARRLLLRDIYM